MMVFDKIEQWRTCRRRAGRNLTQGGCKRRGALTCLPGSPEVEDLYLGTGGLMAAARSGNVLVDMSSVLPTTPRKLEPLAKARGVQFLEAPVSGGVTGARAATLAIMTGGDESVLERVRPILRCIGPNIYRVGPVGAATRQGHQQHDVLGQRARNDGRMVLGSRRVSISRPCIPSS
jgi:hypothetical protein